MPSPVKTVKEVIQSPPSKGIWGALTLGLGPSLGVIFTAILGSFSAVTKFAKHAMAHVRTNLTGGKELVFNPTWDSISGFFKTAHSKAMGLSFFGYKKGFEILSDQARGLQNELGHGSTADDDDDKTDVAIKSGDQKKIQQDITSSASTSVDDVYVDVDNPSEAPSPTSWEAVQHNIRSRN